MWETRTLPDIHTSAVAISMATAEVFYALCTLEPMLHPLQRVQVEPKGAGCAGVLRRLVLTGLSGGSRPAVGPAAAGGRLGSAALELCSATGAQPAATG